MYEGNSAQSKHDSELTRGKLPYQTPEKIKLFRQLDPTIKNVTEFVLFQEQLIQRCHTSSIPTSQIDGPHYYITSAFFYPTLPCLPVINKPALHDQHQQTHNWALNYCWPKTSWASKQDPLLIDPCVKKKHKERKTSKNTDTWKTNRALLMDILQPIRERFKS